jgi:UDP-4-amino-4-deoxy-L-arabinose-oxoglutarate aminotransferase
MKVEFFKHNLGNEEKKRLSQVLDSNFLTTGPVTNEFEKKFAGYLGVKHCVGVSSCTTGNFITLKALGIGSGDEVITTPMSFIATSNTILHAGATPVFVDVEPATGNMDTANIEKAITARTRAILPVHLYGQMCDMKAIHSIAEKYNLYLIEDSAHCIEGLRDGIRPGQLGNAAVFSFYATKNVTSGEGGMIVTNDDELYEKLLKYRMHGMSKGAAERHTSTYQHWDMDLLGYKCNMSDIQASLLLPQLERIENYLQIREKICMQYEEAFDAHNGLDFPKTLKNSKHARHLFTVWVDPLKRDKIIDKMQYANIGITVNYRSIHLLSYYQKKLNLPRSSFPNAERIGDSTITLPLYPKMADSEVKYVIDTVKCVI